MIKNDINPPTLLAIETASIEELPEILDETIRWYNGVSPTPCFALHRAVTVIRQLMDQDAE